MSFSPSRPTNDCDYFLGRAEAEARLAEAAASEAATEAHRRLAAAYLGQIFDEGAAAPKVLDIREAEEHRLSAVAAALKLLSERLTVLPAVEGAEATFADLLSSLDDTDEPASKAEEPMHFAMAVSA